MKIRVLCLYKSYNKFKVQVVCLVIFLSAYILYMYIVFAHPRRSRVEPRVDHLRAEPMGELEDDISTFCSPPEQES